MPGKHGGNSPLGRSLNNFDNKTDFTLTKQDQPKIRGVIAAVAQVDGGQLYMVVIRYKDFRTGKTKLTKVVPLMEPAGQVASDFGSPEDLVGRFWCEVQFTGPSASDGEARIIKDLDYDPEEVAKTNELQQQGSAFASPGSGFPV